MAIDVTGLGAVASLASDVMNRFFPNKSEEERAQLAAALTIIQGQIAVNKEEASNTNTFVSGWRPFIGWVCGSACAWNWIGISMLKVALGLAGVAMELSPASLTEMLPILIGMLGLGTLRTVEKVNSVASK